MQRETIGKYDLTCLDVHDLDEGPRGRFIIRVAGSEEIIATGKTGPIPSTSTAISEARKLAFQKLQEIEASKR